MDTTEDILQLPHIGLNSRALLPEQSGIYYVLDETSIIWYIGQAQNLRSRWAGDSHHRLYQLQKQRKKQLTIYYEILAKSQLDAIERQRIENYNPQLNGTKVKKKNLHPTETLLRETLVILAPYSFVLGVESPRKEDIKFIQDCTDWRDNWRIQKAVLPLNVIHVCINLNELEETFKDGISAIPFNRIKLLFNEDIKTSKLQILPTEAKVKEESHTGLSVRLANLAAKKEYLNSLLTERGLDLRCYQVNKYLERIPRDESYVESNHDRRMIVYVKSFIYGDLRQPIYYTEKIQGSQGLRLQSPNLLDCPYKEIYLKSTVDRAFWLLLENYLSDFAKVELNEEEGYINKVYVSARKFIVPAMLTVTLNGKWKADIPFGPKDDMSCSEVANIIKSCLQDSGIPKIKFLFKSESTRT